MTQTHNLFDINTVDAGFIENPYPTLAELRANAPVHWNPDGSAFLTRYVDCKTVYQSKDMLSEKTDAFGEKFGQCPLFEHHSTSLVFNDPPYHTLVRKLISVAFTPRKIAEFEPVVTEIVQRLLDRLADMRVFDLIDDFAKILPTEIISVMLGIPHSHRAQLRGYSLAILGALDPVVSPERMEAGNQAVTDFSALLTDVIAHRRAHPDDAGPGEVLDALIFGSHGGRRLTQAELIQNCIFLLNAGHETTTSLVGNAVGLLLDHPDQMTALRADPHKTPGMVEEVLRMESPLQIGNRLANCDLDLGGHIVPKGTYIHTSIAGANRDPDVFENPNLFDITRQPNRHLAFITGIHVCLGATLARIEGRLAIGALVRRFETLEQAGARVRLPLARFRGFHSFPVAI